MFRALSMPSIGVCLLMITFALMSALPASAKPKIKWDEKQVVIDVEPGADETIIVEFTSKRDFHAAKIRFSKSIAPLISVDDPWMEICVGENSIELRIRVPDDRSLVGTYKGRLRIKNGKKVVPRKLPITINVLGEKPLGQDQDQDGVWDDVQAAVDAIYADDPQLNTVQSFGARALQTSLLAGETADPAAVRAAASDATIWLSCLVQLQNAANLPPGEAQRQLSLMKIITLNSDERVAAFRTYEDLLEGQVIPIQTATLAECN